MLLSQPHDTKAFTVSVDVLKLHNYICRLVRFLINRSDSVIVPSAANICGFYKLLSSPQLPTVFGGLSYCPHPL